MLTENISLDIDFLLLDINSIAVSKEVMAKSYNQKFVRDANKANVKTYTNSNLVSFVYRRRANARMDNITIIC